MALKNGLVADIVWSLVTVGIIVAGVLGFLTLGALREPIAATPVERVVPSVEVVPLVAHRGAVPVVGEGYLRAVRVVTVSSEAPGRLVELSPALTARGRVAAGELLARIDDFAARAALQRTGSDIDSTRARIDLNNTQLARTESLHKRGMVSQEELDRMLSQTSELAATLASLKSVRDSALIALDATRIVAPFAGRILERRVEVGDVVTAGQPIATLFTPDDLEVTIALEESVAALIPGLFDGNFAAASVTTRFAGLTRRFDARVSRVSAALGERTRTLDVTVTLADPGSATVVDGVTPPAGSPPALVNAWAEVVIDGAAPGPVHAVPSSLVREGDTVWLLTAGTLAIVPVTVLQIEGGISYVALDVAPPAEPMLVTSLLPAPVHGMPVRVATPAEAPAGRGVNGATLTLDAAR